MNDNSTLLIIPVGDTFVIPKNNQCPVCRYMNMPVVWYDTRACERCTAVFGRQGNGGVNTPEDQAYFDARAPQNR